MKIILLFIVLSIPVASISQEVVSDPINEHNQVSSLYLSGGLTKIHYTNHSGIYDSINYTIDNTLPRLNFGFGYLSTLYLQNDAMSQKFLFSYGGELTSRQFRVNYNSESVLVNELFILPMVGIGLRSEVKHDLWLLDSHKAIEVKINLGAPVLLSQSAILNHSKTKSTNSIFFKFHFGLDVKFSSLKPNGKGHQLGSEIFIENSAQETQPNTIPFKSPYYLGLRFYYCILNKSK